MSFASFHNISISGIATAVPTQKHAVEGQTASDLGFAAAEKLLEEKSLMERAKKCYEMMHEDFRKLELRNQIHQKTSRDLDKQQREYFLSQQIKTIQEELGGGTETDVDELKKKAEKISPKQRSCFNRNRKSNLLSANPNENRNRFQHC